MTISLRGVSKQYGRQRALSGIDLVLRPGCPVTLLGKNGAGKTTLLKIIAGLTAPTSGSLDIPSDIRIAYLPEDRGLYGQVDVATHLRYFAELAGVDADAAARQWLERLKIKHLARARVKDLSKGNQQKVQLATCLIDDPECALLDEPFAGLDPINLALMREVIREYSADHYVMLSAHHVDQIDGLSEQVVFLREGDVVAEGPMAEIAQRYGGRRLVATDTSAHRRVLDEAAGLTYIADNRSLVTSSPLTWERARPLMDRLAADGSDVAFRSRTLSELFVELLGRE